MWDKGHTFAEIDDMDIADYGDVIGYWDETARVEQKQARARKRKGKKKR